MGVARVQCAPLHFSIGRFGMKLFDCPHCGQRHYFENAQCLACGSGVLFDPQKPGFILAAGENVFQCVNATECDCNWVGEPGHPFCRACTLNKTIPDMSIIGNRERWTRVEAAKKRAIYSLLGFGLPVGPKQGPDDEVGLAFDFLASAPSEHVMTGHDNGLITLNVAEADSAEREKLRAELGENYRTLLGHFRHELGHYYWDRLIRDDPDRLAAFRSFFGDETADYDEALRNYYSSPSPPDWQQNHISAYAASHPWEDWAETWAHYLHITDTLEMVESLNLKLGRLETVDPNLLQQGDTGGSGPVRETGRKADFATVLERWLVLSEASNSINRCMGLPDLYPFVISVPVSEKLRFVHELLDPRRGAH